MVGHRRHGGAGGQRPGGVFMGGHGEGREGGPHSGQLREEGCGQPQREEEDGGAAARRAQAALRHGAVVVGGTVARLLLCLDEGLEEKRGQSGMAQHLGGKSPPGTHQVVPGCQTGRVVSSLSGRTQISQLLGFPSA